MVEVKIFAINKEDFNEAVHYFLKEEDKKICYCSIKEELIIGGMVNTLEEALELCSELYKEDTSSELSIGDYSNGVTLWNKRDILNELGIISDEEYFKGL